ncbi:MAG: UDP-N-acetylmuramyl-tripeptide synthetase [Candidatus Nomurabacteria bacterium]|nr:UDP-N-acetylmuramyl-tripeptide synthetase [Candidatus Nomurabacteria bacterium]
MEKLLRTVEKLIPRKVYNFFQPAYHFLLAITGALIYRGPSKYIYVIGVTGTKGKSSTAEFINAVLEAAGKKTAILSTIRFKVGDKTRPNKFKMTMPGRFFTQKFLREAVDAKCQYAIIEMTSEGARFFRHVGVELDALIFTNLSPEHIESHGSFEKYKKAKLRLAKRLSNSNKLVRIAIANTDNEHAYSFLVYPVEKNIGYSLKQVHIISEDQNGSDIEYNGVKIHIPIPGKFNISNALAALKLAEENNISIEAAKKGIESLSLIRGRVEKIDLGQDFTVVVDYAHTDDSLRKLYEAFPVSRKIGVLGSTGGGRDSWKRPVLGKIADEYCDEIILTNEDPYDEDPIKIINEVASSITKHSPHIIMDRREAIAQAFSLAKTGDAVLITGKGTDPYIMGPNGSKILWDDAQVAREELEKIIKTETAPSRV